MLSNNVNRNNCYMFSIDSNNDPPEKLFFYTRLTFCYLFFSYLYTLLYFFRNNVLFQKRKYTRKQHNNVILVKMFGKVYLAYKNTF